MNNFLKTVEKFVSKIYFFDTDDFRTEERRNIHKRRRTLVTKRNKDLLANES